MGGRTGCGALRAGGVVGCRDRLALDRWGQPDRHNVHAHRHNGRNEILLFNSRGERSGGDERLAVGLCVCHRNRVRAGGANVDGGGDGARRGVEMGGRTGRGALRAGGVVGCRDRLAMDRRGQPDRHNIHAHRHNGRHEILLFNSRGERSGGDERLAVGLCVCHRACGRDTRCHTNCADRGEEGVGRILRGDRRRQLGQQ